LLKHIRHAYKSLPPVPLSELPMMKALLQAPSVAPDRKRPRHAASRQKRQKRVKTQTPVQN
jgi:hypothetical protein